MIRTAPEGITANLALLPELELQPLQDVAFSPQTISSSVSVTTVLAALGAYALLVLLSIRLMGTAGLATAFLLTGLASLGLWSWLRIPAQQIHTQSLYLNAGKLAQVSSLYQITQLPRQVIQLPLQAHPGSPRAYTQSDENSRAKPRAMESGNS